MPKSFQRDRFFWITATQTAIVNFYLGGFGPAQSLLRADQGTSLTIAGLHGTVMGIASIAAGYVNPHLAHKYGRAKSQWIGLGIFSTGLLLFVISPPVSLTLPATLITGFGTSIVINTMLTSMSHHYGKAAEVAIPQANGIASVGFVTGTAVIGTIATQFRDFWRLGLLLALPVALVLVLIGRDKGKEEHVPDVSGPQSGKMSATFWLAWFGFVACISSEFATSFWSAALLQESQAQHPLNVQAAKPDFHADTPIQHLLPQHRDAVRGLRLCAATTLVKGTKTLRAPHPSNHPRQD